jgi:hypothetical protein
MTKREHRYRQVKRERKLMLKNRQERRRNKTPFTGNRISDWNKEFGRLFNKRLEEEKKLINTIPNSK